MALALLVNLLIAFAILYLVWLDHFRHKQLLLCTLFSWGVFLVLLNDIKNDFRVNYQFIETQCRLTDKSIETKFYTRSRLYYPTFRAEYMVDGAWTQHTVLLNLTDYGMLSYKGAQAIIDQYQVGMTYVCWYDPHDSMIVVFEQGWPTNVNSWKITYMGIMILVATLFYMNPFSRNQ